MMLTFERVTLILAVISILLAALSIGISIWLSNKTKRNLNKIEELSNSIADYTRRPLNGFVEIFHQCNYLLNNRIKTGANIWFVGMTLGFGPAHNIRDVREEWDKKYNSEQNFTKTIESFYRSFGSIIGGLPYKKCLVVLKKEYLMSKFIKPLYSSSKHKEHKEYKEYKDSICKDKNKDSFFETIKQQIDNIKEGEEIHDFEQIYLSNLEEQVGKLHDVIMKDSSPHYVNTIPLQLIVTDIEVNGYEKRACVVFHVGTENVGSGKVQGFYSELPSICEMFVNFAESLAAGSSDKKSLS